VETRHTSALQECLTLVAYFARAGANLPRSGDPNTGHELE